MAFLGIDLGTTNTVGMLYDDRTDLMDVVKTDGAQEVLPSVVCYLEDEILVGTEAKNSAVIYSEETIFSVKRKMGQEEAITVGGYELLPEEVSSEILKKIKDAAQEQIGEPIVEVVITHPAYFNDRQIYATKKAGMLAGFEIVHLLSEPLAAAIEYGYKQSYVQKILIYDLGGGTFDACVLSVAQDIYGNNSFQELADVGDMKLGGDDFDEVLVQAMVEAFEKQHGVSIGQFEELEQKQMMQKIRIEAERAKRGLSEANKMSVNIHPITIVDGIPYQLTFDITRDQFEELIREYIERSMDVVELALERSGETKETIDKVILVGGSTLVPMVKRIIAGHIKEPYRAKDPAKSVAMGAAIYNYLMHLPNSSVEIGQIMRQHIGTRAIINEATGQKALIPILKMGTEIPSTATEDGFKVTRGAHAVSIDCFQWEEGHEQTSKYIGSVVLENITDDSQLSITYQINRDNLFEVEVVDKISGHQVCQAFDRTKSAPVIDHSPAKTAPDITGMDIVFIIDTTSSMDVYIDGVKEKAIEFSNQLHQKGIDYQLGLIGYGDLGEREKPKKYKWTKDIERFRKNVKKLPRNYGGDIPESTLEAVETGVEYLKKRPVANAYKAFIVITDAPPHIPTHNGRGLEDVIKTVNDAGVICYVVAKKDPDSLLAYTPLVGDYGHYYSMDEPFYDILDAIANKLAQLVRVEKE